MLDMHNSDFIQGFKLIMIISILWRHITQIQNIMTLVVIILGSWLINVINFHYFYS